MDQDDQDDTTQPESGPSLLPLPIAKAVSLVTASSALFLKLGTFFGGVALDGARVGTLTGLELGRAAVEGILNQAGHDVANRSLGDLGRREYEGLLERSIGTLHSTLTHVSFAASAGFYISSTALSSAGDVSQQLLTALDSVLGSTDSSRAIASIVTLIRREFENPATGQPGEKVGLIDLLVGVCGLALLQRWCKRLTDLETAEKMVEDVVWDVVIDHGRRADVACSSGRRGSLNGKSTWGETSTAIPDEEQTLLNPEHLAKLSDENAKEVWQEASIRTHIMQNLPSGAKVSMAVETATTKTISVEIIGGQLEGFSPPPGVEVIEESFHNGLDADSSAKTLTGEERIALLVPRYRVIYRTLKHRLCSTSITAGVPEPDQSHYEEKMIDDSPEIESRSQLGGSLGFTQFGKDRTHGQSIFLANHLGKETENHLSQLPHVEDLPVNDLPERPHTLTSTSRQHDLEVDHNDAASSPKASPKTHANQKRSRKPVNDSSTGSSDTTVSMSPQRHRPPLAKKAKADSVAPIKRRTSLRNVLRKGSETGLAGLWSKDSSLAADITPSPKAAPVKAAWTTGQGSPTIDRAKLTPMTRSGQIHPRVPTKSDDIAPGRAGKSPTNQNTSSREISHNPKSPMASQAPQAPQLGNSNYFSSQDLGTFTPQDSPNAPSRASHYSIHERRRDSMVSQTDTYSIHSIDATPGSPTTLRTHLRSHSNLMRAKSEKNTALTPTRPSNHRRASSHVPSIYTLNPSTSEADFTMAQLKGAYSDGEALSRLSRTGHIDGLFPQHHIVRNLSRFVRFASASYGSHFLRVMGIKSAPGSQKLSIDEEHHYEHHSFSHHTQLPASTILLSSFVDPQGGTNSFGETNTGVPMVHFISLDHESKSVVLTCRGTLGFEDILTDMTCDYDDLTLNGRTYKVHKGIHASAIRLLSGNGSRVIATLSAALDEFPDYGLVMCGHSLGGAVVSLLAIMISEPDSSSSFSFVTSSAPYRAAPQLLITSQPDSGSAPHDDIFIPSGRAIHVYAYGPPATLSPSLRLVTRGLITTVINGQDLVPFLSLGVLHDLQAVALAFKTDDSGAKKQVRARVWAGLTSGFVDKWYGGRDGIAAPNEDDEWSYATLKALRASMQSQKLVPPGECFLVETTPVLQRDAFTHDNDTTAGLGRPATRAVLKYVKDVERRFGELRFGGSMLLDHSPGRYEASLSALAKGVIG